MKRTAVAAEVGRALGQARGATRVAAEAAADLLREAELRLAGLEADAAGHRSELEAEREARRGASTARVRAEIEECTTAITGLVGPENAPWPSWEVTEPERGSAPELYRVGHLTREIPAMLPLLDRAHLSVSVDPDQAVPLVATLLLRALGSTRPGGITLSVYDPEQLGGTLAAFAALSPAGLASFYGPGSLTGLLDEVVEEIRRIHETVLAGEYGSLRELAASTGRRPEPWRIVVILGDGSIGDGIDDLSDRQRAQLDRIARTGVACGVHLITVGVPISPAENVDGTVSGLPVVFDAPPPAELITGTCKRIAEVVAAGPAPGVFADLLPEKLWTESSAAGLTAPVGEAADGRLVDVMLGDAPPHALVGGPSGSGKTNLLYAWLGALCSRYSPDELELYLLDFKEGVSFARFARGRRDPSWLPHVKLVGVNVNSDREFGLALLRFLAAELRRRAEAAKEHEATKLEELRAEDPGGRWPRIVAVIDEFQVLLGAGRDPVSTEAVILLEDLARRGRSQGIHLVLASQDIGGIEALWGRSALVSQFTLRIALPKARRMMADNNLVADVIPRYHALINPDSGALPANRVVQVPDAGGRAVWEELQQRLWSMRSPDLPEPRLFDGDLVPPLPLETPSGPVPIASLGETIDVEGRPAILRMTRAPGRNLAVIGTRLAEACAILGSAAITLGRQHAPGTARFTIACLEPDARDTAGSLAAHLMGMGHVPEYHTDRIGPVFEEISLSLEGPHYVFVYAADAAGPAVRPAMRRVLQSGPESRTHMLGWWRSVPRLKDDLGGAGSQVARLDSIGAWVALDVHGSDMSSLYPAGNTLSWYPREHRALFFDRAHHRLPEIMIPYRVA
ncbi:FtsK/SpoIIIE domain-containing protein [Longispora albida]|uniref:FtsK/SpoIIIE domain-containing protein n=1 Tax=Longispora albida TaxID=203523 RepID=UPI0003798A60|nr:FtsK/SpoIIIE domain-containing protein [Longispora albida]